MIEYESYYVAFNNISVIYNSQFYLLKKPRVKREKNLDHIRLYEVHVTDCTG